jgi:hypothetical protein
VASKRQQVKLFRSEWENDQLPRICVRCGQPAVGVKEKQFSWHPGWVFVLLIWVIPYFLLRFIWTKRSQVKVPLCRKHWNHWRWRHGIIAAGLSAYLGCAVLLEIAGPSADHPLLDLALFVFGCLPIWCVVAYAIYRGTIRASACDSDGIILEQVSPVFVKVLEEERARRTGKPATYQCSVCRLESTLQAAFQRRGTRLYCPRCWAKQERVWGRRIALGELAVGPVGLLLVVIGIAIDLPISPPVLSLGWIFLNLFLLGGFETLLIVPHEVAHVVTARLLGVRVFGIRVGVGRTIYEGRFAGVRWEIKSIPLGGITFVAHPNLRWFRLRHWLLTLAGPALHVLLLFGLLTWISPETLFDFDLDLSVHPAAVFFWANVLLLTINLLPFTFHTDRGRTPTDGLTLLAVPFLSRTKCQELHACYFAMEAAECLRDKQYDRAAIWYQRGLAHYPTNQLNRINLGVALLNLKQFCEARRNYLGLLERPDLDANFRPIILNNIAVADILMRAPKLCRDDRPVQGTPLANQESATQEPADLLTEADRFSTEALAALPWMPTMKGTRGSVLVEMDRLQEGSTLLMEALQENETAENKAFNLCYLALAAARKGNVAQTCQFLESAQKLAPDCMALPRVGPEILSLLPQELRDSSAQTT